MSWTEIPLGEALRIKHGFAFQSAYFSDDGPYVVLTPGNFRERGGFRLRPEKDRAYLGDFPESYVLEEGDLVVVMTEQGPGLLGSSAIVPGSNRYLHNQRLGLVEDLDESVLNRLFLYHLFNTRGVRAQISSSASGTKVRHTSPERIYRVCARIPDLACQERIAKILSAYDDLIENNRRRIALLEEAARLLYREWFVHFRFPGHEHVETTDGLPDGWESLNLGEITTIRKGQNITKATIEEGDVPVVAGGLRPAYYHSMANALGPVVTVSASGANAGYVALYHTDIWASDCSYLSAAENLEIWFLYLAMKSRQTHITSMQQGAAQPHVYPKHLGRLSLVLPPANLRSLLHENVDASFRQISTLEKQNQQLAQARDLLLPRLINGEVAV